MKKLPMLCILALLLPMPLIAQNLILNPGFDSDLSDWDNPYSEPAVWDNRDANGSAASGSVVLTNTLGNSGSTGILSQCFDIQEAMIVNYSARVYQPSGQTGEGYGHIRLRFYSETGCQSFLYDNSNGSRQSDLDTWFTVSGSATAGVGAASFRFYLAIVGTVLSEDFSAHFDNVVMMIVNPVIFEDSFE